MRVADNGIGMPKVRNRKAKSFGLAGIRERIATLKGRFSIESSENGTALTFMIPCDLSLERLSDHSEMA
jgi:signal transduction histidine kinase